MEVIIEATVIDEHAEGCTNYLCPTYAIACQTNSDD